MEEENYKKQAEEWQYQSMQMMSPEIVEIGEDSKSFTSSREGGFKDVYVAVGRDDLDVLKWALDHSVSPQARIFLVHVFPPLTYISTPVGRLSRSQLSKEQLKVYINEENNRRRNLLQKYIRLCTDAKVTVDTMLLESNTTAKAILDLIPVLNITNLVIGTKRPPCPRRSRKKLGTGEFIQKNAPEFCEVTIVFDGKKVLDSEQVAETVHSSPASSHRKPETTRNSERNFFECVCFSVQKNNTVYRSNNISHRSPHHLPDAEREGKNISRGSKTQEPLLVTCMQTMNRHNITLNHHTGLVRIKAHHEVNRTEARTVSVSNLQHPNICGSGEHENPTAVCNEG